MLLRCLALALLLPTAAFAQANYFGDYFGASVASIGDLDGDGVAEFAVGAHGYTADGVLYIYSGATYETMLTVPINANSPEPTIYPDRLSIAYSKWTIVGAGDINADGTPDLFFGDPGAEYTTDDYRAYWSQGRAFALDGATGQMLYRFFQPGEGEIGYGSFGRYIVPVGDVNADGISDVAISAISIPFSNTGYWPGRVLVLSGANGELLRTDAGEAPTPHSQFQAAPITQLPDVDGDGVLDYYTYTRVPNNRDYLQLIISGRTGETLHRRAHDFEFWLRPYPQNPYPQWVAVPDEDADGFPDVATMSTLGTPSFLDIYSSATMDLLRRIQIPGVSEDTQLYNVTLDGDRALVRVKYDPAGPQVINVLSVSTGEFLVAIVPPSDVAGYDFGGGIAFIPDTNGDGVDDLLVGAANFYGRGLAFIFSGADGSELRRFDASGLIVSDEEAPSARALAVRVGPNPVRGRTAVTLTLPAATVARASVFDVLGREVSVLADGAQRAGETTLDLDASGWAPGVYVVRLATADGVRTTRLTVAR